jgi:hypothetical protein
MSVAIVTPWRVGGLVRLRLRSLSAQETEVEVSGLGLVRRDVERMAAALTAT